MSVARYDSNSSDLVARTKTIATEVAARFAPEVDRDARFPRETVAALKEAKLLSAAVPRAFGGLGAGMQELGAQCAALAAGCGSSGMVLAMHHIQAACIARHAGDTPFFQRFMRENLVARQQVVASITSEVGTFGDTRSSICAVEVQGDRLKLDKEATTASYGEDADAQLVTCRRNADAPNGDQVLVLFEKPQYTLTATTAWDTLGMRGTCSPGGSFRGQGAAEQILPGSFAESAAQTMVPYSHILWSALWTGIAADAVARAGAWVRAEARKKPGTVPQQAHRLAQVQMQLQSMRNNWESCAYEFDALEARGAGEGGRGELNTIGWALKMNNLKMASSEAAPKIVHEALQIIGINGYKNDSKFSVGRHYRDALSASLMISNDRIAGKSASMLLVFKDS